MGRYYGISRTCFYRWLRRYQDEGIDGLRDRSSRPHHSPNATHAVIVNEIVYLRQNYHFGPLKIAMYLKRYHDITIGHRGPQHPQTPGSEPATRLPALRSPRQTLETL